MQKERRQDCERNRVINRKSYHQSRVRCLVQSLRIAAGEFPERHKDVPFRSLLVGVPSRMSLVHQLNYLRAPKPAPNDSKAVFLGR